MALFNQSGQRLPGLNFDAPPGPRDLEFQFDDVFADEQRRRLQALIGQYRATGAAYGILDESDPATASAGAGRPLTVQPNAVQPLYIDVTPGVAVTRAGNIIEVPDLIQGVPLAVPLTANRDIQCVVLLEYLTVDDADTNVVTAYGTVEATRRVVGDVFDSTSLDFTASNLDDLQNASQNLLKVVTLQTFVDGSKFTPERLNNVVVLGLVKVILDPEDVNTDILSVDMTNTVAIQNAQQIRPWFSAVDQEHRAWVGTGSTSVPHQLGLNDLSQGDLTLYQQMLQHGIVISRDMDVPGCPGKLCTEFVDQTRVFTDSDGSVTGTVNRKYVKLASFPNRLLAVRANKLEGSDSVVDTSVGAHVLSAEIVPGTNVLALGLVGLVHESFNATIGFTVYYTDSDASRPPALPNEIGRVANGLVQFYPPASTELIVAGGKAFEGLPNTSVSLQNMGPFQKQYRVWMDSTQQYVAGPQPLFCSKLVEGATGIGTAVQTPQFTMYGPARIRVGLWNAPLPVNPATLMSVELVGTDVNGSVITETVTIAGTSGSASPRQVAWSQPNPVPAVSVDPEVYQVTNSVFYSLTSFRVTNKASLGADALIMVWADLDPTVTTTIKDALPVANIWWTGQVTKVSDLRPVLPEVTAPAKLVGPEATAMMATSLSLASGSRHVPLAYEDLKSPHWQDNVLSKRDRHNDLMRSMWDDEFMGGTTFGTDGTPTPAAREWYYSRPILLPSTQTTCYVMLFCEDKSNLLGVDETRVEFQVASASNPAQYSPWTLAPTLYTYNMRSIDMTASYAPASAPYFKIRFRIISKGLKGFAVVLRRP